MRKTLLFIRIVHLFGCITHTCTLYTYNFHFYWFVFFSSKIIISLSLRSLCFVPATKVYFRTFHTKNSFLLAEMRKGSRRWSIQNRIKLIMNNKIQKEPSCTWSANFWSTLNNSVKTALDFKYRIFYPNWSQSIVFSFLISHFVWQWAGDENFLNENI